MKKIVLDPKKVFEAGKAAFEAGKLQAQRMPDGAPGFCSYTGAGMSEAEVRRLKSANKNGTGLGHLIDEGYVELLDLGNKKTKAVKDKLAALQTCHDACVGESGDIKAGLLKKLGNSIKSAEEFFANV